MIVKVCGMRDPRNIRQVAAVGVQWMGLIFYSGSARCVTSPVQLPSGVKGVGVFVNEDIGQVVQTIKDYGLELVQLHGLESPTYLEQLRDQLPQHIQIVKAISLSTPRDLLRAATYAADYLIFDTPCPTGGGSGRHFDWHMLEEYDGQLPFLLSGGIGPHDVERIRSFRHPQWVGVDLNSRFELAPAYKDAERLRTFIQSITNSSTFQ